jgi:hypothetical protein
MFDELALDVAVLLELSLSAALHPNNSAIAKIKVSTVSDLSFMNSISEMFIEKAGFKAATSLCFDRLGL